MKLSVSSLNTLTKCGYKYYLEKVKGLKEPGKRKYNQLQGDIVADAIQSGCLILNGMKTITDQDLSNCLLNAYADRYNKAGIGHDLLNPIMSLLSNGISEGSMGDVDMFANVISCSEQYEFEQPAALKSGKVSTNKKKPPLSMKVVRTMEDLQWFFDTSHPHYAMIRDAATVENEKVFDAPIGEMRQSIVNGKTIIEQDSIPGRFDTLLTYNDSPPVVLEYKYTATTYTNEFVNRNRQVNVYYKALNNPNARVILFDLPEHKYFQASISPEMQQALNVMFEAARKMLLNETYLPLCGCDPYTEKFVMCGFKNGGCQFGPNKVAIEEEDVD